MADVNGKKPATEEDWEYEDEDAEDYEWEYGSEEEEDEEDDEEEGEVKKPSKDDIPLDEQDLPDPFATTSLAATTKKEATSPTNGHTNGAAGDEENGKKKHKKQKKSRHLERIELFKEKEKRPDDYRNKKIHVRSKDPSRIARQFEKADKKSNSKSFTGKGPGGKRIAPPSQKINQICKVCNKEPYLVERVVAEKSWWHKNCFRCTQCNKILSLDTYMSHEGVLYCKPHHKELFQPKVVRSDIFDVDNSTPSQEAIHRHQEQQRRMETIIRESNPVPTSDDVVKCSTNEKFSGLENLNVGAKYKMFETASSEPNDEDLRGHASDRYGIMEKLKRLQEGADLDDLLAEMDEELPSDDDGEEYDEENAHLTEVQRKTRNADKLFSEDVKKHKKDEATRKEMQALRKRLNCGGTNNAIDAFDDLLNASSNRVQKTKVDVRSENAKKFRDMFDKGEVPEGHEGSKVPSEKDAELEMMRKAKRQQREREQREMEAVKVEEESDKWARPEPKLLVGKLKDRKMDKSGEEEEDQLDEDLPELASLSNRFSYFENFNEHEHKKKRSTTDGGGDEQTTEGDSARRECKAKSVLNKFKEMENRVLNGEDEVPLPQRDPDKPIISALGFLGKLPGVGERRRPLKRFTPPRNLGSDESESDSGSEGSDSECSESSYTSTYSSGSSSDSEDHEDETLKAIRNAQRAKELRGKFEAWEQSQDAKDQLAQMSAHDENGEPLETAGILRRKFEALRVREEQAQARPPPIKAQFRPKRFK